MPRVTKAEKQSAKKSGVGIKDVILPYSTEVDVKDYKNSDGSFRAIILDAHRVKTPLDVVFMEDEITHHKCVSDGEPFSCRSIRVEWTDRLGNRQEIQIKLFT